MIKIEQTLVKNNGYIYYDEIKPHEKIIKDRTNGLINYINSIDDYKVIPSIIICKDTNVIIDGHHRYYALVEMGYKNIPVTQINYGHDKIVTHTEKSKLKKKNEVIYAGLSKKLMEPKSTKHSLKDLNGELHPIILISRFSGINK